MITDKYGQQIYSEKDLCDIYLQDPTKTLKNVLVANPIHFFDFLELENKPEIKVYSELNQSIKNFDEVNQSNWLMPKEYLELDIAKYILDLCKTDEELQRVGEELLLYQERDMFNLLRYLKYLVDTMRKHNIVWGVGRGSSTASYILFLLGVHKINSLYYSLDIREFFKF